MTKRDLIVMGGSAGAVEALQRIVRALPPDLPAALLVVVHIPATARSLLPDILQRSTALPVAHAAHGEEITPGRIVVGPPDHHLLVHGGRIQLTKGPRENGHRPAIDPLFRSAARWGGRRVIAVALSGTLDDGAAGMLAVTLGGGLTIAQDPQDASFAGIPQAAIHAGVDHVATADAIGRLLVSSLEAVAANPVTTKRRKDEAVPELAAAEHHTDPADHGGASGFTCPDCNGALWELRDRELVRFRCRVGHTFAPDSLLSAQQDAVEDAMWAAYRALEEAAELAKKLQERASAQGMGEVARRYGERYADALGQANVIRRALERDAG